MRSALFLGRAERGTSLCRDSREPFQNILELLFLWRGNGVGKARLDTGKRRGLKKDNSLG